MTLPEIVAKQVVFVLEYFPELLMELFFQEFEDFHIATV